MEKPDLSHWTARLSCCFQCKLMHADACSGTVVEHTASSGTIQSPGYDSSSYPDNSNCQWRMTAPPSYVRLCLPVYLTKMLHIDGLFQCIYSIWTLYQWVYLMCVTNCDKQINKILASGKFLYLRIIATCMCVFWRYYYKTFCQNFARKHLCLLDIQGN